MKTDIKLKEKDFVLVRENFIDDVSFAGFGGRIQRIGKTGIIKVVWDSITLLKFSEDDIKFMIENDYYLFDYNFGVNDIYPAQERDTWDEMFDTQEKMYNLKLSLVNKKISDIEMFYDRFVLSPFYWKLPGAQQDRSWSIIDIFSSIMSDKYGLLPNEWSLYNFINCYETEFRENVVASKAFFKYSKNVLLQFAKFLAFKDINNTDEIQNYLKST